MLVTHYFYLYGRFIAQKELLLLIDCFVGTIGALFIERPSDVVEGFDRKAPLVYQYGSLSPGSNTILYDLLVKELADVITRRCASSPDANFSGVIINTCGWIKGEGLVSFLLFFFSFLIDSNA